MQAVPNPPSPPSCGSTTLWTSAATTAASTAFPPVFNTRHPASTASGWGAATHACIVFMPSLLNGSRPDRLASSPRLQVLLEWSRIDSATNVHRALDKLFGIEGCRNVFDGGPKAVRSDERRITLADLFFQRRVEVSLDEHVCELLGDGKVLD